MNWRVTPIRADEMVRTMAKTPSLDSNKEFELSRRDELAATLQPIAEAFVELSFHGSSTDYRKHDDAKGISSAVEDFWDATEEKPKGN